MQSVRFEGLPRIETFLAARGWFDARAEVNERAGRVVFRVQAGEPTRWRNVPSGLKSGERFDHAKYLALKRSLEDKRAKGSSPTRRRSWRWSVLATCR